MRKKYIRVADISLLNLTHTELMNFMERVLALLPLEAEEDAGPTDPKGAPKVGITGEQVRDAQDILREMNDLQMASKMKAETKPKKEADRKRDALLAFIIDRVDKARFLPIEAEQKAAEHLYIVVKPYRGAGKLGYNRETETIKGLLLDLGKPENQDAVRALNLETYVDALHAANEEFDQLVKAGDVTRSVLNLTEKMDALRKSLIELYREMMEFASATNLLHETEESVYFVSGINALIQDVKANYNLRISKGKKKEGEEEQPEEKPDGDDKGDSGLEFVPVEK